MADRSKYAEVQAIAKSVLRDLGPTVTAADSEATLAERAKVLLAERGIVETWYHNCPALVLLGSRSCLSISGRDYTPSDEPVGELNAISIDLSPTRDGIWGDCARTFFVENERFTAAPLSLEFKRGIEAEKSLHEVIQSFVSITTTFEQLFAFANAEIARLGFENLDLFSNLGHSLATRLENRIYIEAGNSKPLGEVPFFTFEPHIREICSRWGFKHEEVYYFDDDNRLCVL